MKKIVSLITTAALFLTLCVCLSACENKDTTASANASMSTVSTIETTSAEETAEATSSEKPTEETKHTIPTSVLDNALSNCKFYNDPFSISVGKLVNSAMDGYQIEYLKAEEAISRGYLTHSQIEDSIDLDYLYYAIISGDAMVNPEIPYMTEYEAEAVKVWMLFDEFDQLINSGVTLCSNLQTCAILLMTSRY